MNFTLLVVALVLTHVYLVAATGGSSSRSPDCVIVTDNDMNLYCMNGKERYGFLQYSPESTTSIEITQLSVGKEYRQNGVATALLNYFIKNIARKGNFKQIELMILDGKDNVAAVKLYKKAGFEFVAGSSDEMILQLE